MNPLLQGIAALGLLLAAPLTVWSERRVKAWSQLRRGPPLLQPYRDLRRLLHKEPLAPAGASPFFATASLIGFGICTAALFTLPLYERGAGLGGNLSLVILGLLFALHRWILAAQAYDTGTAFGGLGSSRELFLGGLGEPALLLVAAVLFLSTGSASVPGAPLAMTEPASWLVVAAITMLWIAESARIPFDNPATHLELTMVHEAMILEAGGWMLAAYESAAAIKQITFAAVLVLITVPVPASGPVRVAAVIVIAIFLSALLALAESGVAKVRLFRASHLLVMAALLAFLGGVVLFITGGAQ